MKKIIKMTAMFAGAILFMALMTNTVSAQTEQKQSAAAKTFPADVSKVIEKSCVKCHKEPGNKMALSLVDLSKWDKYEPVKQAEKAKKMCKMITKGKMPPKGFRKEHPNEIPTDADIKVICDWANSLQPAGK
jgi:cytochrome c5